MVESVIDWEVPARTLKQILTDAQHIRIISHKNPDGDALGSMLAFRAMASHFQCSSDIVLLDPVPYTLSFLFEKNSPLFFSCEDMLELENEQTDLVCFLDCGQISRAGVLSNQILKNQTLINIDHHLSNPLFGDFNLVLEISSTCEILFHLIKSLNIPIDSDLAKYLYTGIVTDSGLFQYDRVTKKTFEVVTELVACGVVPSEIYKHIYQNHPISWLTKIQDGLNNLEFYKSNQLAVFVLPYQETSSSRIPQDNIHILFSIILAIDTVKMCILVKEREDRNVSASIRSKSDAIDVSKFAQIFGGGGHRRASGCSSEEFSLSEFKNSLVEAAIEYL